MTTASTALIYDYRVRDKSGEVITGELEASSAAAVSRALREKGLIPLQITERKPAKGLNMEITIPGLTNRVKMKDVAIFSRQFATMVNSGLSLIRALNVLEDQTENKTLAGVVSEVRQAVERGTSLSAALEEHPKVFNPLYVSMIRAGEVGGVLDETLLRLADMIEASVRLRSKVKSAMAYPIVVLNLVLFILGAMLVFVVPMFESMYADLGGALPAPTQMLINVSGLVRAFWYIVLLLVVVSVFSLRRWIRTDAGRLAWDAFKLRVPIFGGLAHKSAISRFSRTFSVLSRTGVPILQAIDIVADTSGNEVLARALDDVKTSVKEGESLTGPLYRHAVFPPMVVQMMTVGEETGALDTMLAKVSDFYDSEVNATVDALTSLIEPLLIIVMGATVGGILIALYLPMFNIANLVG